MGTLHAKGRAGIAVNYRGNADLGEDNLNVPLPADILIAHGTGANQADVVFADRRTLAASATEDLDLSGTGLQALGANAVFAKVKGIYVKADSANTNNVIVGNATANAFVGWVGGANDDIRIQPGGAFVIIAPGTGYTVTAGTGDLLRLANSGGTTSVTYDIVIIGTSV